MVLTILEAKVEERYWQILQDTYETMTEVVPSEIKNSYLVQAQKDKSIWRILTFWDSQVSLNAMRESGETPTGILIFQKANAKPNLLILDVIKSTR
jgi:hypothetical protein